MIWKKNILLRGYNNTFNFYFWGVHSRISVNRKTSSFSKAYVPSAVEVNKYVKWESDQKLQHENVNSKNFSIIMPPPNVTGNLHLGHALTLTIQDVLVRWNKMHGAKTLWIPGMDHAGIATQVIVEKILWNERQQSRHDIGRDQFQQEVFKWKDKKCKMIQEQIKKLGVLPDWSKEFFTLDDIRSKAVTEAFIKLFESGMIYRADYIVNWSCILQSAISDIEVDHINLTGRTELSVPNYERFIEFGVLTKFAYKLCETDGEIVVATTRPETIFGDVAVAVHPSDSRYSHLKDFHVFHPFRGDKIPVIYDESVNMEFGTGAVKVTPGHDPLDFEIGKRHSLKSLQVIDEKGLMNDNCGFYAGMKRFDVRKTVVQKLEELGHIRGKEDHPMVVPICSRSKDVIEYLNKPQWFLSCDKMAAKAIDDVKEGRLVIDPPIFNKTWFNWLENIRDWCISRQLWWGHKIPAFLCHSKDQPLKQVWVASHNVEDAIKKAAEKLLVEKDKIIAVQDEDVLDTWFSSALLPFAALEWPNKELNSHYPLSLMETGHDILFFWVARMVMLGTELTGKLPFNKILLHGIICDAHGRKMSKSLGNVISPEDVIFGKTLDQLESQIRAASEAGLLSTDEYSKAISGQKKYFPSGIPECGTDALRFTLCSHNIKNHFINFDINECHTNKLFCNKIWQALNYTRLSMERVKAAQSLPDDSFGQLDLVDKWILSRLCLMVSDVHQSLDKVDLFIATAALKQFFYNDFCDVYLETTKPGLTNPENSKALGHMETLIHCFDVGLRCLYPFMPFLTQELHQHIPKHTLLQNDTIGLSHIPDVQQWRNVELEKNFEIVLDSVTVIRRLKKSFGISVQQQPTIYIVTNSQIFQTFIDIIQTLTGFKKIVITDKLKDTNQKMANDTIKNYATVYMEVPVTNKDSSNIIYLEKKIDKIVVELEKIIKMSSAESYKIKVAQVVQEKHLNKISSLKTELDRLRQLYKKL